jgi:hypothetical protein
MVSCLGSCEGVSRDKKAKSIWFKRPIACNAQGVYEPSWLEGLAHRLSLKPFPISNQHDKRKVAVRPSDAQREEHSVNALLSEVAPPYPLEHNVCLYLILEAPKERFLHF